MKFIQTNRKIANESYTEYHNSADHNTQHVRLVPVYFSALIKKGERDGYRTDKPKFYSEYNIIEIKIKVRDHSMGRNTDKA